MRKILFILLAGCQASSAPAPPAAAPPSAQRGVADGPFHYAARWDGPVDFALLGHSMSNLGDINGDGWADIAMVLADDVDGEPGMRVYLGTASGIAPDEFTKLPCESTGCGFIGGVGDVNGDGYDDFLLQSRNANEGTLYYGGLDAPDPVESTILVSGQSGGNGFGEAIAALGDINGDGFGDFAVGQTNSNMFGDDGTVWVFEGSSQDLPAEPSYGLTIDDANEFSRAMASGDFDGDGHIDLLVSDKSGIYVVSGTSTGLAASTPQLLDPAPISGIVGNAMASGDFNGDGLDDVVVQWREGSPSDTMRQYLGTPGGLNWAVDIPVETTLRADQPPSVADIQGDGFDDILLPSSLNNGHELYYGTATGLPTTVSEETQGLLRAYTGDATWFPTENGWTLIVMHAEYQTMAGTLHVYETDCPASDHFTDEDEDGFGAGPSSLLACHPPAGFSGNDTDCNDSSANIHPDATEVCDSQNIDEDCNGVADNDDADAIGKTTYFVDEDQDGWGTLGADYCSKPDLTADRPGDCDDTRADVNPEELELCDSAQTDEDCNGLADDLDPNLVRAPSWHTDTDRDGFGDPEAFVEMCVGPAETVLPAGDSYFDYDCDDTDPTKYPGAPEICDGVASSCALAAEESDIDSDHYVECTIEGEWLGDPSIRGGDDCDDHNIAIHPGQTEWADDGVDSDCDGEDGGPHAQALNREERDEDEEVGETCGCSQPATPAWLGLPLLALLTRRR